MDDAKLAAIVDAIVRELQSSGAVKTNGSLAETRSDTAASTPAASPLSTSSAVPVKPRSTTSSASLNIDLPDPTGRDMRSTPRVKNPKDAQALKALMASTPARIGVG
ncbi:MAG: hypothetical protein M3Y68_02355, partial [Chloroflexota bacterium]|nr:hypothetical protein [Chloroflexota bacterium]